MATYAENLTTIRDQITARILAVTASNAPDYSENGRSISKSAYLANLMTQLGAINELIVKAAGPWEVSSRGIT